MLYVGYLWQVPGNAAIPLFCPFYLTLQPAVGQGVLLVEVQLALVSEEAIPSLRRYAPNVLRVDESRRKIDEVLLAGLQLDALLPHHRKLRWPFDENLEAIVCLVKGTKGHSVGVEVQGEPQSLLHAFF